MNSLILQNLHESLEGCELGTKFTFDGEADPKVNFHYIKDWCDYRLNMEVNKETKYEDKFAMALDRIHPSLILGTHSKGSVKNWFTDHTLETVLFCNIPNTSATVGAMVMTNATAEEKNAKGEVTNKGGFGLTGLRGFWRNETAKGVFAHDATWTKADGVKSEMVARLD